MRFEIWCLDREGRPTWCTGRLTPPPNLGRAIPLDRNPEATAPSFAYWLAADQQRPLTHSAKRVSSVRERRSREGTGNSGREIRPVLLLTVIVTPPGFCSTGLTVCTDIDIDYQLSFFLYFFFFFLFYLRGGPRTRRSHGVAPCHRVHASAVVFCGSIFRGRGHKALIKILQRKPGDSLHAAAASRGDSLHLNRRRDAGENSPRSYCTHRRARTRTRTHARTAGALYIHTL